MSGYRLAATAESDVAAILDFIAERDGVDRALAIHDSFVAAFEMLVSMPRAGRRHESITGCFRWWSVFGWLVIYDGEVSPLNILRVVHGARELRHALGGWVRWQSLGRRGTVGGVSGPGHVGHPRRPSRMGRRTQRAFPFGAGACLNPGLHCRASTLRSSRPSAAPPWPPWSTALREGVNAISFRP